MSDFMSLTADSMQNIEHLLFETLQGTKEEETVNSMCMHVVRAGGKRMRPRLALLCGFAQENNGNPDDIRDIEKIASAVELLHTASLIHDDVIDKATVRRGQTTLNDTDGNHAAVLAGDYMFTRCFVLLHGLNCMSLFDAMAATVSSLVTGELEQLKNQGDLSFSAESYCRTIYCKTGALFELACCGAALFRKKDNATVSNLQKYGRLLGQGFQVADDLLDYTGMTDTTGKDIGEDLAEGRITLPLIMALDELQGQDREFLQNAANAGDFKTVHKVLSDVGALEKTQAFADQSAKDAIAALDFLPQSPYRDALCEIAIQAVRRKA